MEEMDWRGQFDVFDKNEIYSYYHIKCRLNAHFAEIGCTN